MKVSRGRTRYNGGEVDMSHTAFIEGLDAIRVRGGSHNRLVVGIGSAWFVFRGSAGNPVLRCEAAGKSWLPVSVEMGLAQVNQLRASGFVRNGPVKLLSRDLTGSAAEIVDRILPLFESVYDQRGEIRVSLFLGDEEELDNPALMSAMRRLSKERTMDARQELYRALYRSELLILVDERGDLRQLGTLGDRPVYAVFTDWESLKHWDPRGHTTTRARGSSFFRGLAKTAAGSLLINPEGMVGGELYRNEILAIGGVRLGR